MPPRTTAPIIAVAFFASFIAVISYYSASAHNNMGTAIARGMPSASLRPIFRGARLNSLCTSRPTAVFADGVAVDGDRIKLHLRILDEEGSEISTTKVGEAQPLIFTAGQNAMMPGIDNNIVGMKVGDTKTVDVEPKDAFGEVDEERFVKIPSDKLPEGTEIGAVLRLGPQGFPVRLTELVDGEATLDMNHPLAGKNLKFELELIDATEAPPALKELELETLTEGDGETFPKAGDVVSVHYSGRLIENGLQFDSSLERGPFEFIIGAGQVIQGWDEGVMKMCKGQKAILRIPSEMGYGQVGAGGVIPPGSDLEFTVELLDIKARE